MNSGIRWYFESNSFLIGVAWGDTQEYAVITRRSPLRSNNPGWVGVDYCLDPRPTRYRLGPASMELVAKIIRELPVGIAARGGKVTAALAKELSTIPQGWKHEWWLFATTPAGREKVVEYFGEAMAPPDSERPTEQGWFFN